MIAQTDYLALGSFAVLVIGALTTGAVAVIRALHENTRTTRIAGNDAKSAAISARVTADQTATGNGRSMAELVTDSNRMLQELSASVAAHHANTRIHRTEPEG